MKKMFSALLIGGLLVSSITIFATKAQQKGRAAQQISANGQQDTPLQIVYFMDTEEFLAHYEGLMEQGHTYTLALEPGKGIYIVGSTITNNAGWLILGQHDFSTKDKIKFAKWCNDQLNAGKVLTIGKDKDGTYWADVK